MIVSVAMLMVMLYLPANAAAVTYAGPYPVYHWLEGGYTSIALPISGTTSELSVFAWGMLPDPYSKLFGAWCHTSVYKTIALSAGSINFKCNAWLSAALVTTWGGIVFFSTATVRCVAEIRVHSTGALVYSHEFFAQTIGPWPTTWSYATFIIFNGYVGYLNAGTYDFIVYLAAAAGVGSTVCRYTDGSGMAHMSISSIGY